MDIKMIVMDWAGTTVDYGCFAPVHAFAKAFEEVGITPTMQEIREPMGLLKMDHIRAMLSMKRIQKAWIAKYQQAPTADDVEKIYDIFEKQLFFKDIVDLFHIVCCRCLLIFCDPGFLYTFHGQHCTNMIHFE